MPKLPDPLKALDDFNRGVDNIYRFIDTVSTGIDKISDALGDVEENSPPPAATYEEPAPAPVTGASNETTLKFQLDHILDDIEHLETEHLPEQGRLNGEACDCIAKASRSLRRHVVETIPIASRQGKNSAVFSEIRDWAQHMMDIGTIDQVTSGRYNEEYLIQAGTASNYRKQLEKMLKEISGSKPASCPTCEATKQKLNEFIKKKKGEAI